MATRMSGAQRREQLLDATKAIVVADGFHAVSIEAVAREAGITRPIVYGHFEDLGGLLEALVERESRRALAQLPDTLRRPARRAVGVPRGGADGPGHVAARADAAAGRAAAAARADRGGSRGGDRAAGAGAASRAGSRTRSCRRTCSPPTPTRPPGSCCRITTWNGSSSSRAGRSPVWLVILVDVSLLRRRRDLRLLIVGYTVSFFGTMFTQVALAVQVYDLTGSTLAVGMLGVAEFVPIVALALVGGALADAFDRRKLIWRAELTAALVSAALVANTLLDEPRVWVLFVAAAIFAGAAAVLRPPLDALMPRLVERDELKAASAIHGSLGNFATIAGPALAGVLIAATDVSWAYGLDLAQLRGVADRVRADAHPAAAARRGAAAACAGSSTACGTPAHARNCSARTWSTSTRCSSACRSRFSRRSPTATAGPRWSGCCGRRRGRLAAGDGDQRLGLARASQRARDRAGGRGLGRRDRALRTGRHALARAAVPRARRRRGRDPRHLPRRAVERDDPGPHARAARGRGDDLVVVGAAARQRPRGDRRFAVRAARRRSSAAGS